MFAGLFLFLSAFTTATLAEIINLKDGSSIDALDLSKSGKDSYLAKTKYGEIIFKTEDIDYSSGSVKMLDTLNMPKIGSYIGMGVKEGVATIMGGGVLSEKYQIGLGLSYGRGVRRWNSEDRLIGVDIFRVQPLTKSIQVVFGVGAYKKEETSLFGSKTTRRKDILGASVSIYFNVSRKALIGVGLSFAAGPVVQLAF